MNDFFSYINGKINDTIFINLTFAVKLLLSFEKFSLGLSQVQKLINN